MNYDRRRQEMERIVRTLGSAIGGELEDMTTGPKMGFMLMVFDFDTDPPRPDYFSAYISNAHRADMVKLLREQADRLEAGTDNTKGQS